MGICPVRFDQSGQSSHFNELQNPFCLGFVRGMTQTRYFTFFDTEVLQVVFSIYHYILERRVSRPSPLEPIDIVDLQQAFKRVLQSGLASLPEDGRDEAFIGVDRPGSPAYEIEQLAHNDERAIDFRNRLRTW